MGDDARCFKIMESFSSDIKGFYVKRRHSEKDSIEEKQPVCVCIILEKGKSAAAAHYSNALDYSKRTRCPVYVICSPDQFYGLRKSSPKHHLHRVNISGLYKAIRHIVEIASEHGTGSIDFEIAKSRFETVEILSERASFAAYCADKVHANSCNSYRIIISSSSEHIFRSHKPLAVINACDKAFSADTIEEVPIVNVDISSDNSEHKNEELISQMLHNRRKALIRKLNN